MLGNWRHRVSRSDWIGQLHTAGARDVLLLEVPIPLKGTADDWQSIAASLQRAEEQYRSGDYHSCIEALQSGCRDSNNRGLSRTTTPLWNTESMTKGGGWYTDSATPQIGGTKERK